jgi:CheY-like chemotaxis protein
MDKRPRILVVEDDRVTALMIRKSLEQWGYEIAGPVSYGEEVVPLVQETEPSLVLMDIKLKGDVDGIEATRRINELFNIPVIYLTGNSDKATLKNALKARSVGYLKKPVNKKDLRKAIDAALNGHV